MGENTLNGSKKHTQFEEELLKFPPTLRKLAKFISLSDDFTSIAESARRAGLDPKSVNVMITHQRKKGNNFNHLLRDYLFDKLASHRAVIMASVIREAQKGSYRHAELYFRLLGDLHQEPKSEGNTTTNNLTFVMAMPKSIPMDQIEEPKEHNGAEDQDKVIDVELIPEPEKEETAAEPLALKFEVHRCPFCRDSFETPEMLGEHLTGEHERE